MVVLDPEPRDCFAPRSLPATIFGLSERVSGAYVVYQQGKLKDAVNVQATDLTPQELVYVKAQLQNWDCPEAPQKPPSSDLWDASKVDISVPKEQGHQLRGDRLLPADAEPQEHEEAPLKEELPERPLIRPEEVLETLDQEPEFLIRGLSRLLPHVMPTMMPSPDDMYMHASLCRRSAPREPRMGGVRAHWQEQRSDRATQMPQNSWMNRTPGMMMISMWWAPNFKISQYLHLMVTIFENRDQRDQNTRIQQRLPEKVVRINSAWRIHLVLWRLVKLRMK